MFDRGRGIFINGRLAPENDVDVAKLKNTGFITKYFFSNEKISWMKNAGRVPCVVEFSRITAVQLLDRGMHQEINIVYDGGERANVIVIRSLECAERYARQIAELVKVDLQESPQTAEVSKT